MLIRFLPCKITPSPWKISGSFIHSSRGREVKLHTIQLEGGELIICLVGSMDSPCSSLPLSVFFLVGFRHLMGAASPRQTENLLADPSNQSREAFPCCSQSPSLSLPRTLWHVQLLQKSVPLPFCCLAVPAVLPESLCW